MNPPKPPSKDIWEVKFVKLDASGEVVPGFTFTRTFEEYGAAHAANEAVDFIEEHMHAEDSLSMRILSLTNLTLRKKH